MVNTTRLSFIICSWQGPATLDDTLQSIFLNPVHDSFEVVLVNNGFAAARANELKSRFPQVRFIDEPKPGLAAARVAGYFAAHGEFFVCLDDDNVVGPGFVAALSDLIRRNPNLGGVCPLVIPRWEREPPRWLQEFGVCCLSYNAVSAPSLSAPAHEQVWHFPNFAGATWPPGGGMIIHRMIAEDYLLDKNKRRKELGRNRNSLGGSEDQDIFGRTILLQRDIAYSDQLVVQHQIPVSRTKWRYLLRLNFRMTQDWAVLARLWRREKHPYFHSSPRIHLCQLRREVIACLCGQLPPQRTLLETVRHIGFLYGWIKDGCRKA